MLPQGVAILCVVADDRPGLVALVSAAFLAHALDVRSAQIYCRNTGRGAVEAVDFFWLRNVTSGTALDAARLEACARTIRELLVAEAEGPEVPDPAGSGDAGARVSYAQDPTASDRFEVVLEAAIFPDCCTRSLDSCISTAWRSFAARSAPKRASPATGSG